MKPDEQRIAIAEWMGWTQIYNRADLDAPRGVNPHNKEVENLLNYPLDLNAMHEAEKKLTDDNSLHGKVAYNNVLMRVCGSHAACVSATASQRSEALCRTLWPERFKQ